MLEEMTRADNRMNLIHFENNLVDVRIRINLEIQSGILGQILSLA